MKANEIQNLINKAFFAIVGLGAVWIVTELFNMREEIVELKSSKEEFELLTTAFQSNSNRISSQWAVVARNKERINEFHGIDPYPPRRP